VTKEKPNPYRLTTPCANCPFRTDVKPYLRPERVEEMQESLTRSEFPCHKTLDYSKLGEDDVGYGEGYEKHGHCAGALILLEKIGEPSQMMRICERIGLYDPRKLDMDAPVFDSWEEMIEAQRSENAVRTRKEDRHRRDTGTREGGQGGRPHRSVPKRGRS
jgi:hypothetical protein